MVTLVPFSPGYVSIVISYMYRYLSLTAYPSTFIDLNILYNT